MVLLTWTDAVCFVMVLLVVLLPFWFLLFKDPGPRLKQGDEATAPKGRASPVLFWEEKIDEAGRGTLPKLKTPAAAGCDAASDLTVMEASNGMLAFLLVLPNFVAV
jgi:hypothetical protein